MIVHWVDADTEVGYVWDDDDGDPVTVADAVFEIDGADASTLIDYTTTAGTIELIIPDDYSITAGNHTYELRANDGAVWTILAGGLLRVR